MAINKKLEAEIILKDTKFLKTLDKMETKVKNLSDKIQSSGKEISIAGLNKLNKEINKAEGDAKNLKEKIENLGSNVKTGGLKGFFSELKSGLSGIVGKFGGAAGVGAAAAFGFKDLTDQEQILKKARLELGSERGLYFSQTVEDIRKKQPELSRGEIAEANFKAFQSGIFKNQAEAVQLGGSFAQLASFGKDTTEITKAVSNIQKAYGDVPTEQILEGLLTLEQQGVNLSDDLFDTYWEYSQSFKEAGYSFNESLGLLKNGIDSGAFNTDKIGDLVKENIIKIQEQFFEGQGAENLFKGTGIDIDTLKGRLKGVSKKQFGQEIIKEIQGLDEMKQKEIIVGLYGTMAEDLGTNVVEKFITNFKEIEIDSNILEDLTKRGITEGTKFYLDSVIQKGSKILGTTVGLVGEELGMKGLEEQYGGNTFSDEALGDKQRYQYGNVYNINTKVTQEEAQKITKQQNLNTPK